VTGKRTEELQGLVDALLQQLSAIPPAVGADEPLVINTEEPLQDQLLRLHLLRLKDHEMEGEPPQSIPRELPQLLGELATALAVEHQAATAAAQLVGEAREAGATWQQIADAAGMRRQSAYQRWSDQGRTNGRERKQRQRSVDETASGV
jgi:hypothetical protein